MRNSLATFLNRIRKVSSLSDQVMVSGGNFLTIAICAHALPLSEQGKFTYVFASYMGLLLLNVAGIFQGAAVRAPVQDSSYQVSLARLQSLQAFVLSLLICLVWWSVGNVFGWQPTVTEDALLFVFLVMQQLADFDRRSAYIFAESKRAILSSALLYPGRIFALIIIRPDTVSQVLVILIISAIIPATFTVYKANQSRLGGLISWIGATNEHFSYSKLFIIGAPLGWLWAYIPIFMLGMMHGKEQAALLASIRGISNIANVLMEQIETKVVADWARVSHSVGSQAMKAEVSRLLKIGIVFWLIGMMIVAMFGREIVELVLGNLYGSHWHLLVVGWVAYGIYFLARLSGIKRRALGENRVEFIGSLLGVCAAIIAGLMIIPALGAVGAAWVYVIIAVVMMIGQWLFTNWDSCRHD